LSPRPDASAGTSFNVRFWKIEEYKGKRATTYYVRWTVDGAPHKRPYATRALADSTRSHLLSEARKGTPFDRETGLPITDLPPAEQTSWYAHACEFVDAMWPRSAPRARQSRADALATVTPALLATAKGRPADDILRAALYSYAFNSAARAAGPPPDELAAAVRWLERSTVLLAALDDEATSARLAHAALDSVTRKLDGRPAAANTIARKRAVLYSALRYAVELRRLNSHPLDRVTWRTPKTAAAVDRRVVVDHRRARLLLAAVREVDGQDGRLEAFFACMYYAALRPGEVTDLRLAAITLPEAEGWGEFALTSSNPATGRAWADDGTRRARQLKHRAEEEVRFVPIVPQLAAILRRHLREHGTAPDGRLFPGHRGGPVSDSVYGRAWQSARAAALTPTEAASQLARRPYDLRHAAVSTWLNAGVPATQVAEWAGHSVHVLYRVYAKCVLGQDEASRRRIEAALSLDNEPPGRRPLST
jgi:integrase